MGLTSVQVWRAFNRAFSARVDAGQRDLFLIRWNHSGVFDGAFFVPLTSGFVHMHAGRWACTMIEAISRHRLRGPRLAWLYASDVVRPFPWRPFVSGARCASSLLVPTAPASGARCTWLLPTPYEISAVSHSQTHATAVALSRRVLAFASRIPIIFFRAGWARSRRPIFALGAQPQNTKWLNASVVRHKRVPESEFVRFRYLLDVGGVSGTTWGALRWKLLSGSLVLKVSPPLGPPPTTALAIGSCPWCAPSTS